MKFQPRPRFEALAVRGGRIFPSKAKFWVLEAPQRPWTPRRPLDAPGAPWRPLQGPGALKPRGNPPHAWMKRRKSLQTLIYTMAYNIYYDGFGVLGTLNWDLRWIMTRALLRDTRSFRYWLDPNIHLDYWSSACGHQKVFRLRMPYTKHYFGPKAINFGNW